MMSAGGEHFALVAFSQWLIVFFACHFLPGGIGLEVRNDMCCLAVEAWDHHFLCNSPESSPY